MASTYRIIRLQTDPIDGPSYGCLPGTQGVTCYVKDNVSGEVFVAHVCQDLSAVDPGEELRHELNLVGYEIVDPA